MIDQLFGFLKSLVEDDQDAPAESNNDTAIALAAAALMMEVARSDSSKQSIELDTIADTLKRDFSIPATDLESLVAAASDKVETATDLYQFTQLINNAFDASQKIALIHAMWRVAFADGHIDAIEDHIIRRVAGLLHVQHSDFVKMKLEARTQFERSEGKKV